MAFKLIEMTTIVAKAGARRGNQQGMGSRSRVLSAG